MLFQKNYSISRGSVSHGYYDTVSPLQTEGQSILIVLPIVTRKTRWILSSTSERKIILFQFKFYLFKI